MESKFRVLAQPQRMVYTCAITAFVIVQNTPLPTLRALAVRPMQAFKILAPMQVDADIRTLPLDALAMQCAVETRRFLDRKILHDTRYCFELFRRALVENGQDAYARICLQYEAMVAKWVRSRLRFTHTEQDLEECVNGAFASMFRSLSRPGSFAGFESLERILAYMQSCAISAAETENRKHRTAVELTENVPNPAEGPERKMIRAETSERVQQIVLPLLKDERERIVYESYFALDLKPRVIYEMNPTIFANVREVYRVKQIMLERFSRALRHMNEELSL